jgi:fatty-acyl-CoA synthase
LDPDDVRAFVRKALAGYKTPKLIVVADCSLRASNGKADYPAAKACAEKTIG